MPVTPPSPPPPASRTHRRHASAAQAPPRCREPRLLVCLPLPRKLIRLPPPRLACPNLGLGAPTVRPHPASRDRNQTHERIPTGLPCASSKTDFFPGASSMAALLPGMGCGGTPSRAARLPVAATARPHHQPRALLPRKG
eukprot:scaffold4190_cov141-Isochrysis_galbana.AAC.2